MINLDNFPRLKGLIRTSSDISWAYDIVSDLYQEKKRVSGRLVIEHCLETAENTSHYTVKPIYLITAVLHDVLEDCDLTFKDLKSILGPDGDRIAWLVKVLSKRSDLQDKERNTEYMNRISKATWTQDRGVGIVKLADRLSNLTDLKYLPQEKRMSIANQTLEFYVPLASNLALSGLANKLRIMSLPYN